VSEEVPCSTQYSSTACGRYRAREDAPLSMCGYTCASEGLLRFARVGVPSGPVTLSASEASVEMLVRGGVPDSFTLCPTVRLRPPRL